MPLNDWRLPMETTNQPMPTEGNGELPLDPKSPTFALDMANQANREVQKKFAEHRVPAYLYPPNDLPTPLNQTVPPEPSPVPATDKPEETPPSSGLTFDEWEEKVIQNMKRLATDEEYRKEIAKNQF